jgi:hypothetical protein
MLAHFPKAVPVGPERIYVILGNDQGGIGGISQGECRMFLTNAPFRQDYGNHGMVMVWLNLNSKQKVDGLYHRWRDAGRVFYDFSGELRQA